MPRPSANGVDLIARIATLRARVFGLKKDIRIKRDELSQVKGELVAVEQECRRLGIDLVDEPTHPGEGVIHGRTGTDARY